MYHVFSNFPTVMNKVRLGRTINVTRVPASAKMVLGGELTWLQFILLGNIPSAGLKPW